MTTWHSNSVTLAIIFAHKKFTGYMTEEEKNAHVAENPDHASKIYDSFAETARQYGCKSVDEFIKLNSSLKETGPVPVPPAEMFE